MISKELFLKKYIIQNPEFEQSGLKWQKLVDIYNHYNSIEPDLKRLIASFIEMSKDIPNLDAVNVRIKNPERLIAKIIRHTANNKIDTTIDKDNYHEFIKDLIGVRFLYTFKSDFYGIHKEIMKRFEHNLCDKKPTFFVENGKNKNSEYDTYQNEFYFKTHPLGYYSINYHVYDKSFPENYIIDIQLLTLFENAWNTVNDKIKQRRDTNIPIVGNYLNVLKKISSSADDLASHILYTKDTVLSEKSNLTSLYLKDNELLFDNTEIENLDKLKGLIAKDKIQEVLNFLNSKCKLNNELYNEIILITQKFNSLNKSIRAGIINLQEETIMKSKFNHDLISLIDEIGNKMNNKK